MNSLFKLMPVVQALRCMLIFPFWYIFHHLFYIPKIKEEAEMAHMDYEEYIQKVYAPDVKQCAKIFKEVNY